MSSWCRKIRTPARLSILCLAVVLCLSGCRLWRDRGDGNLREALDDARHVVKPGHEAGFSKQGRDINESLKR